VSSAIRHPALGALALFVPVTMLVGLLAVRSPQTAAIAAVAPLLAVIVSRLHGRLSWTALVIALGGSMILGYGFVNVPALTHPPIPLVDVFLCVAFIGWGASARSWPEPRLPFHLAGVLFAWATVRLCIDAPTWGGYAFRDYATYVEFSALFVGYWAIQRVGLERWLKTLSWTFRALVVYGLLTFVPGIFSTFNFTVGLNGPTLLFGSLTGLGSIAAFFFFALCERPTLNTALFAAAALPPLFKLQSRGLYLALILAFVVVGAARFLRPRGSSTRFGAIAGFAVAAAVLVLALHPTGRFGGASVSLITKQMSTLVGGSGPGAGTITTRKEWFTDVSRRVAADPGAVVYGFGLGPDLTNGFGQEGRLTRKPHDDYLEMYARLGAPSLLLFVLLLGSSLRWVARGRRQASDPKEREFLVWVLANSAIYLLVAATQPLLAYPFGTIPLFAVLGAGLAVAGRAVTGESVSNALAQ
jgi:hypothetical protein